MIEHVTSLLPHASVLVGLFSRLTPTQVLSHHGRQRILAIVEARPNVRQCDLRDDSGLAEGTLRHHARVLERAGFLRIHVRGRARRFVARSTVHAQGKAAFELTEGELRCGDVLLESLLNMVGSGRVRLSAAMQALVRQHSVTRMGAWKAAQRAVRHGLLVRTLVGHQVYIQRPEREIHPSCQTAGTRSNKWEVAA